MSELKAFDVGLGRYTEDGYPCVVAFDADGNPRLLGDEKVYLKYEADKVIAHHKYKRCLAMANWCGSEVFISDYEKDEPRMRWWVKWQKRWLELAEKFKEAK